MSNKSVRRGYVQSDEKEFNEESVIKLKEAQKDIFMLLNRDYPIKNVSVFVGNHYLLSERQRLALARATSKMFSIESRKSKISELPLNNKTVYIDGFNIVITLEVALSNSTLLKCMDGTVRDLAGLRGTYKLIDKTDKAIELIGEKLKELQIGKAVFFLDKPVSNSGRLRARILELLEKYDYEVQVELVQLADKNLEGLENVVSSDAIVLDKSTSWINMASDIIDEKIEGCRCIDLCKVE